MVAVVNIAPTLVQVALYHLGDMSHMFSLVEDAVAIAAIKVTQAQVTTRSVFIAVAAQNTHQIDAKVAPCDGRIGAGSCRRSIY